MKINHLLVVILVFVLPVVQRVQTPRPPTAARQSQADKSGPLVKAASSALKGKESSSSSDSEDETVPASLNLPPPPSKIPLVYHWCLGPCVFSFSVNFFDSLLEQHTFGAHEKQSGSLQRAHNAAWSAKRHANYSEADVSVLLNFCICFILEYPFRLAKELFDLGKGGGCSCF